MGFYFYFLFFSLKSLGKIAFGAMVLGSLGEVAFWAKAFESLGIS